MTAPFELVAIVASAGGLRAMEAILEGLPADFPIPIALVQHRPVHNPDMLVRVLSRHTPLTVKLAQEGEKLRPATLYIAQPNLHLVMGADGSFGMRDGAKIRHTLSSGNPLFESAAATLGSRVIAVVLSGYGRDGTDGVQAIHRAGGIVLAQDGATSQAFGMPSSAIGTGCVDTVLPVERIAPALVALARRQPVQR